MAGALGTGYDPSLPAMGGGMKKRSRENKPKARPCKALLAKGRSAPKAIACPTTEQRWTGLPASV